MGDNERQFTLEDAVLCAQRGYGELLDVDMTKAVAKAHCPHANHRDSKKLTIKFNEGWFNCIKCQQTGQHQPSGGGPVSLFMHVTGITDSTEAARKMHELLGDETPNTPSLPKQSKAPEIKSYQVESIKVRDRTYRALFSLLVLTPTHRKALLARGLTDEQIDHLGYRSLPRDKKVICEKLLQMGHILEGVPGFYKDKDGAWTMNIFGTGIFVPWKNAKGQIEFLQIRKDKAEPICRNCDRFKDGKCLLNSGKETSKSGTCDSFKERGMRYFTYSSPDKDFGSGAKTWVHGRKGAKADGWKEVIITEGALKADVASAISGKNFLAVQGVGNTGDLPRALRDLRLLGLEKVYLCYDNEPDNPAVIRGEDSIKRMLEVLRVPYQKVTWEELDLKGIDDWLNDWKK